MIGLDKIRSEMNYVTDGFDLLVSGVGSFVPLPLH